MTQSKRIVALNTKTNRTTVYSSARAASRVLSGKGSTGSEKTITKYCKNGGGQFRNTWVSYEK